MAQFVVPGITLAGPGSIQLHVQCFQLWGAERAARYRLATGLGIRRRYRACRVGLMPAARSVSSGLTIISSPASRTATNAPSRAT
jgi:hypothetical protein